MEFIQIMNICSKCKYAKYYRLSKNDSITLVKACKHLGTDLAGTLTYIYRWLEYIQDSTG